MDFDSHDALLAFRQRASLIEDDDVNFARGFERQTIADQNPVLRGRRGADRHHQEGQPVPTRADRQSPKQLPHVPM